MRKGVTGRQSKRNSEEHLMLGLNKLFLGKPKEKKTEVKAFQLLCVTLPLPFL